jgi:transcriptional regulator of heat shock response
MDPSTYHDLMINLATNSPFLAWMIYSYVQTNKDLKETREQSRQEAREIRTEAKEEEQRVRDRFENVIKDLNEDRKLLVEGFSNRIDSLERDSITILRCLQFFLYHHPSHWHEPHRFPLGFFRAYTK